MDVEESHIMFPEISTEETERSKDSKDQGVSTSRIRKAGHAPERFVRKSTWQVADVRRPPVSAYHIIQAGNDLFIGKDEACIMNRREKKKSLLRKEVNVYVLDLFVEVPPSAVAPSKYKFMEVDVISRVADGREQRRRVTFDCNGSTF